MGVSSDSQSAPMSKVCEVCSEQKKKSLIRSGFVIIFLMCMRCFVVIKTSLKRNNLKLVQNSILYIIFSQKTSDAAFQWS